MATRRAGINMKRHYIKWSEVLSGISAKDQERINNSVQLYVRTPKGWNGIGVFFTRQQAEEWKQRIILGKITLKYEHEKVFKIG
jgi:hypothetical protein